MSFEISTDKTRLDLDKIHNYVSQLSYWGAKRSLEETQATITHSFCFGMYDKDGDQIAYGRVLTDFTVFAYLMDIIVFEPYQGKGFGKELMKAIMTHEKLKNLKTMALKTKDAHSFYEAFGFEKIGDSPLWMAKDSLILT